MAGSHVPVWQRHPAQRLQMQTLLFSSVLPGWLLASASCVRGEGREPLTGAAVAA